MKRKLQWIACVGVMMMAACSGKQEGKVTQPVHIDVAYEQPYSKKFTAPEGVLLRRVYSDRNGVIQIYGSTGLLKTFALP